MLDRRHAGTRREHRRVAARRLHRPAGLLTNDFFINVLDPRTEWKTSHRGERLRGPGPRHRRGPVDRHGGRPRLRRHAQLRALAEVYASGDGQERFVRDFVAAWTKVMEADRFDLA